MSASAAVQVSNGKAPLEGILVPEERSIFEKVRIQLKARLGSQVYGSWFGRVALEEAGKNIVRLSVPTAFLRSWINSHYPK